MYGSGVQGTDQIIGVGGPNYGWGGHGTDQIVGFQGPTRGMLPDNSRRPYGPNALEGTYTTSISDDRDLLIRFNGNQVSILNGCNAFSGSFKVDNFGRECQNFHGYLFGNFAYRDNIDIDKSLSSPSVGCIEFGQLDGTNRACANNFDSLYTSALSNSAFFKIEGNRITLKNSKREVTIILTLVRESERVTLEGKYGKYSTNLLDNRHVTIELSMSGVVNLLGGCNYQTAHYKAF
jgi:heat shock protein HslJ